MNEDRPSPSGERLWSLDLLRGFALLGILVINIRYFAAPLMTVFSNDPFYPGEEWHAESFWTWFVGNLFFEDKMIALFSMLFGAGLMLQKGRGWWRPVTRMIVLFGIGAAHAFGLWVGDILMVYAVCGLLLLLFRWVPPGWLFSLGILSLLFAARWNDLPQLTNPLLPDEVVEQLPTLESEESKRRRGEQWRELLGEEGEVEWEAHTTASWSEQFEWRADLVWFWQFQSAHRFNLPRCGGLMLIGMALFAWGWLDGSRRARTYAAGFFAALLVGGTLVLLSMLPDVARNLGEEDSLGDTTGLLSRITSDTLHFLGAPIMTFAMASFLLWIGQAKWVRAVLHPVSAVGRMALTNYLGHTIACVVMIEGWGYGNFGAWNAWEQFQWVSKLWVVSLLISTGWLLIFRQGPFEWLWRSLSNFKLQPMRRPF